MSKFRYQARTVHGEVVSGAVEASDRRSALELMSGRGLFPSSLEPCAPGGDAGLAGGDGDRDGEAGGAAPPARLPRDATESRGGRIRRREVTAFTRGLATLLSASIPIPQALESLGAEEQNPALREVILDLVARVRRGISLSAALQARPRLFPRFYASMVHAGEEAGALDRVLGDLADLLEHEDETRGEVMRAVAYPCFVLALGAVTTFVLLAFVLPRLFEMLQGMLEVLPLPTRVLLAASDFFQAYWALLVAGAAAAVLALRSLVRSSRGALLWDAWKMRLPVVGSVFRASALGRFARMLGVLLRSGVSLLPALEIVKSTLGNRLLAARLTEVAEETRGGDSLAAPLRKTGLFPSTMVQMIAVGEETGKLDEMLLRVAGMEERQMRGQSRTLVSLLAPALILVVGALVGFIVIALLLPIFRMSQVIR